MADADWAGSQRILQLHVSRKRIWDATCPRVEHLVPEWKARNPGETVWFCNPKRFDGQGKMIPAIVEPDRAFAMVTSTDWQSLQTGTRARRAFGFHASAP